MNMNRFLRALFLLMMPSNLISYVYGKKLQIGFSLIIVDDFICEGGVKIGHFNLVFIKKLNMNKDSHIGKFNYIKGGFTMSLGKRAEIKIGNKVSGPFNRIKNHLFKMGDMSSIQTNHIVDMTGNIVIGNNVLFAGVGSQIWTHHFQFAPGDIWSRNEVVGDVKIGDNVIVNSRCTLCDHIVIGSGIVVAANTCIYKNLLEPGLYVGSSIVHKVYNSHEALKNLSLLREFDYEGNRLKLFKYRESTREKEDSV